jgi:uncharacterized protein (DUF1697 family)
LKTFWIALFRGINVGGRNLMPMASLKTLLESIGCKNVQTYIQSGNVIFESLNAKQSLHAKIASAIEVRFGFSAQLILLTKSELENAINSNPFSHATNNPKTLHFFFMNEPPNDPDLDAIETLLCDSESCLLVGSVFYFHAPSGIGRSKAAAVAERKLGTIATARNYNTVAKLSAMSNAR